MGSRPPAECGRVDGDRYAEARTLREGEVLRPGALRDVELAVAEILPKA